MSFKSHEYHIDFSHKGQLFQLSRAQEHIKFKTGSRDARKEQQTREGAVTIVAVGSDLK